MPAKEVLSLSQLVTMLKQGPLSPADLTALAPCSLATANRKLKEALTEGLAVKVGKGPATKYRLVSEKDDKAKTRVEASLSPVLALSAEASAVLVSALKFTASLKSGDLSALVPLFGELAPHDSAVLSGLMKALSTLRPTTSATEGSNAEVQALHELIETLRPSKGQITVKAITAENASLAGLLQLLPAGTCLSPSNRGYQVVRLVDSRLLPLSEGPSPYSAIISARERAGTRPA